MSINFQIQKEKIKKIRFEQYHVKIDGTWYESKRIRNSSDGLPCIVCGKHISEFHLYCRDDKRCKTLGKKMNLCMGKNYTFDRSGLGIHKVVRNDWRYNEHYSFECETCEKQLRKEKMPQSVIDERYPPNTTLSTKIVFSKIKTAFTQKSRCAMGELRHNVFVRDKYKCSECGISKDESPLEVDHIIPVSKGGLTELNNLQLLCKTCNRSKFTRTWIGGSLDDSDLV